MWPGFGMGEATKGVPGCAGNEMVEPSSLSRASPFLRSLGEDRHVVSISLFRLGRRCRLARSTTARRRGSRNIGTGSGGKGGSLGHGTELLLVFRPLKAMPGGISVQNHHCGSTNVTFGSVVPHTPGRAGRRAGPRCRSTQPSPGSGPCCVAMVDPDHSRGSGSVRVGPRPAAQHSI